jgi:hypothetical protein
LTDRSIDFYPDRFDANGMKDVWREEIGAATKRKESDKLACLKVFHKTIQSDQDLIVGINGLFREPV